MRPWSTCLRRAFSTHRNGHARSPTPKKGDRVVVAMSGGVDSSVVAKLLSEQDYDLSAIFMRNWDTRDESGTDSGCEWKKDWQDVQRVCKMLDIPCKLVDLSREYWTRVFQPALAAWETGATPNPDIWCNKEVKFGALMDHLTDEDAWLATGHYARKSWSSPKHGSNTLSRPKLLRPSDRTKDQTYYLSSISEASLARTLFPIAHLPKSEVKENARAWGLPTAQRPESMGICFVGEKKRFDSFLTQYIPPNPGKIVDYTTSKVIGEHHGLWTYTIGQNARVPGQAVRMFVSHKDAGSNIIYVVPGPDHPSLFCTSIVTKDFWWIWEDSGPASVDNAEGFRARMQFRHRMLDVACTVRRFAIDIEYTHDDPSDVLMHASRRSSDNTVIITFDQPQLAVAPGQVAAVWDGDWCLGSGVIEHTSR